MTEASVRLANGLELLLDEPEGNAKELLGLTGMNHLGVELVDRVTHHHAYEGDTVQPRFLNLFPEMSPAVDLLENDHDVLQDVLISARREFASLHPDDTTKSQTSQAFDHAQHLRDILHRHTNDEEDL